MYKAKKIKNALIKSLLKILIAIICFLCPTSCSLQRLNVQTHYVNREQLASYHVYTPDPHKENPTIGQTILIQWHMLKQDQNFREFYLHLAIRFRNRREENIYLQLTKSSGTYLYHLLNENFCFSGGIATYKIDLIGDECLLESWTHPLWVDLISFDFSTENTKKEQEIFNKSKSAKY
ncbi:hypothetical protein DB44_CX00060 [Candidatus Protochlamydia amoebophila]|uniref:Uncharacterized protein n=1 Tax=Candidatus Protochlamydia amoebophila TaxID=362787 RepID=A0A0C1JML9_9BACT|nr:hypothetical protein DB44_CX00060 [Candidatus Protochlamydia amoebophila]